MNLELQESAYLISWDLERFQNSQSDYDLEFLATKATGAINTKLARALEYLATPYLVFQDLNGAYQNTDFPYSATLLPIVSRKFTKVLEAFPNLKYKLHPALIVQKTNEEVNDDFYNADSQTIKVLSKDFFVLQLLEHTDVFDWQNSVYVQSDSLPERAEKITEYVLLNPETLPPIFRLMADPMRLFVSDQFRMALKVAGVLGIEFQSLKRIQPFINQSVVDHPVQTS
jgi:hypothetical protein